MDTLRRTNMHFVHCLLPQTTAGLSDLRGSAPATTSKSDADDYMLNVPLVRLQVRGSELLDAVRLHRHGERVTFVLDAFSTYLNIHNVRFNFKCSVDVCVILCTRVFTSLMLCSCRLP